MQQKRKPVNKHTMEDKEYAKALKVWKKLKPVYFQKWVWFKANKHNPDKYPLKLPTYQGKRVILT